MSEVKFWKDPPVKPLRDWRTWMIGLPVLSSGWGGCWFMFLAFSFTELGAIPDAWRTWIVVMAAFGTAFGSAFGSIGSSVEIYSKAFEKRAERLDWISLALSIAATMGGFILGFAALLAGEEWAVFVRIWGPIALSILVGGDAAGDLIELGGIIASYNMRYKAWETEKQAFDEANGIIKFRTESLVEDEMVFDPSWPTARMPDFDRLLSQMNGSRATLDVDKLTRILCRNELNLPHRTTLKKWVEKAQG